MADWHRTLVRLLRRVSPRLAEAAREVYLGVSGRRSRELRGAIAALALRDAAAAAVQDSLARLQAGGGAAPRLAVVSNLPPSTTGIATSTIETYSHAAGGVDIYAPFDCVADYFEGSSDPRLSGTVARVFAIDLLPRGLALCRYRAVIFELGNSDHNLPVFLALRRLLRRPKACPVYVRLHDPCVLNLLDSVVKLEGRRLPAVLAAQYGDRMHAIGRHPDTDALCAAGILGGLALFAGLDIDGFVVNSAAAEALLRADNPALPPAMVRRLFHPVFTTPAPRPPTHRIGTFGIPSDEKLTHLIIAAFRKLPPSLGVTELVIAGFEAGAWAEHHGLLGQPGLVVVDRPGDARLLELMRGVGLGIQLRRRNLGESSGVVPLLLGLGVPTLVSGTGSFLEYGEAVGTVPPDVTADELARVIAAEIEAGDRRAADARRYAEAHGPAQFCARLLAILDPAPREVPRRVSAAS